MQKFLATWRLSKAKRFHSHELCELLTKTASTLKRSIRKPEDQNQLEKFLPAKQASLPILFPQDIVNL